MFASSNYPPDQAAADRFVAEMRHGTLIACSAEGYPQVSILPFVKTGDLIELHCVQGDPTFDAVRANPRVTFFVSDFLAWSPHSWVSDHDAGRATLHFRAVAFECEVERLSTDPNDVAGALSRLLAAYEPGASYEPMKMGEFYGPRLQRLATMKLRIVRRHIKFKTGPAATAETTLASRPGCASAASPATFEPPTSSRLTRPTAAAHKSRRPSAETSIRRVRRFERVSSRLAFMTQ